jgi:hypothetical protein
MSDELLNSINNHLLELKSDVSGLKTDMKSLVGNGKPGRIDKAETDIEELKASKNQALGIAVGFGSIGGIWEFIKWKYHL